MSQERVCSIILELPKTKEVYLRQKIGQICRDYYLKKKDNLHLSIEPSFRYNSENLRENLDDLLKKQMPFEIELDKVALFQNSQKKLGLVYLTTDDEEQIKKLNYLNDKVKEITNTKGRNFVPHVALIDWAPINKIIEAGKDLQQRLVPVKMPVSELALKTKMKTGNWENYGRFSLGGDNFGTELVGSKMNEMVMVRA